MNMTKETLEEIGKVESFEELDINYLVPVPDRHVAPEVRESIIRMNNEIIETWKKLRQSRQAGSPSTKGVWITTQLYENGGFRVGPPVFYPLELKEDDSPSIQDNGNKGLVVDTLEADPVAAEIRVLSPLDKTDEAIVLLKDEWRARLQRQIDNLDSLDGEIRKRLEELK